MQRHDTSRRRFLALSGTTFAAGLAGCAGGGAGSPSERQPEPTDGTGPSEPTETSTATGDPPELRPGEVARGSLPAYASLIPASLSPTVVTAFDTAVEADHSLGAVPDSPSDPLRFDPCYGAVAARVMGSFLLGADPGFSTGRLGLDGLSAYVGVDGVGVGLMPVDAAGAIADASESGVTFHHRAEGQAVFTAPDDAVFGVTDEALLFAPAAASAPFDPVARVQAVLAASTGDAPRRHEADETFAALLQTMPAGGTATCVYAPDTSVETAVEAPVTGSAVAGFRALTDGFGAATGAAFHLDPDNGDPAQPAVATLAYPDEATIDAGALTGSVGTAATDRTYVRSDATVQVRGRYDWGALAGFERGGGAL